MLQSLVGNKSVERILLALLVNEKSYATELHKWLETPLNPIQKALSRLEKGGILTSYFEGKTRIYHFNPSFPLLQELEALLKKAYSLASPLEKKRYFFLKDQKWGKRNPETKATVFEKDRSLVLNLFSQMKKIV